MTTAATPPASTIRAPDARRQRASGLPLGACRLRPRIRRPHRPDRARLLVLSNDPDHDPRRPFWIVGAAADRPEGSDREWHMSAEAAWAGPPPADDRASRVPHPAVRQLVGYDLRERPEARAVGPLAISWDHGRQSDEAGVVWYTDGSTLPLPTYCAALQHAATSPAWKGSTPRALTWTAAPDCPFLQAEQRPETLPGNRRDNAARARIAMCVKLKRSPARDTQAVYARQLIEAWNRSRTAS